MEHAIPFGCGVGDMLTTIGPLARSVDDLELSLKLIAGPDGIDYTVVPMAWRESAEISPANLRIAMSDGGLGPIDPAIESAIHNAAAVLMMMRARSSHKRHRLRSNVPRACIRYVALLCRTSAISAAGDRQSGHRRS